MNWAAPQLIVAVLLIANIALAPLLDGTVRKGSDHVDRHPGLRRPALVGRLLVMSAAWINIRNGKREQ